MNRPNHNKSPHPNRHPPQPPPPQPPTPVPPQSQRPQPPSPQPPRTPPSHRPSPSPSPRPSPLPSHRPSPPPSAHPIRPQSHLPPPPQFHPPPPEPQYHPQPPPQSQFPPPPYYPPPSHRRSRHSNCASCILATFFLLIIAGISLIACFILFRPQSPKIAVNSVKFPAFAITNNTVDFTCFQYVAVQNPNRYSFSHYDSSLQLYYSGSQLGFLFIPAGEIAAGRTQYVSATFNVRAIPVVPQPGAAIAAVSGGSGVGTGLSPTLEVETRMKMAGRVRVLKLFAHHVESRAKCMVTIEVSNGNVLGFHC